METAAQLDGATKLAIIPTVVLPFTVLGMILTSVATWIAALFGVQLKAEGPKKLFELLFKPKVLLISVILNGVVYGLVQAGQYVYNGPYPLWWVRYQNSQLQPSKGETNLFQVVATENPNTSFEISSIETVWQSSINDFVFGAPQVFGSQLYAGTNGGRVLEIDIETGKTSRQFEVGKPVMTSPVFWNDYVFVGEGIHTTHDARLYKFALKDGTFTGAFATKGHIERAPIFAKSGERNLLFVPAGKDGIYAVDAETMIQHWHAPIGHVDSSPVADEERIYGGTGLEAGFEETPTKVFALDIHTGKMLWERALPTSVWSIPVLWSDYVCYGVGDVYKNTRYGQLTCLDKKTGKDYVAFNTTGSLISKPTVIGDSLIVADFHGKIYQFNLKEKTLDWEIAVPTKGYNYASVFVDNLDRVILPGAEGLYVYNRNTQKLLFNWIPKEEWKGTFTNVVPYKDLWLLADRAGYVRALRPL